MLDKSKEIFILNMVRLRENRGFTQDQMAGFAGVGLKTYQKYEYKKAFPMPEKASKIAEALGVTVSDLYKDPYSAIKGEKPASSQSRAELILEIQSILPALQDDQLRSILALVNEIRTLDGASNESAG